MKRIFGGFGKCAGVYKITNTINEKIYIGSAKCFQVRASQHLSSLKNNKHRNKHLQASFNKHGSDAFLFEVVEVVPGDKLSRTTREQFFIDCQLKNWEHCYNHKKKSAQKEGPWSNTPKETKKKLSNALKKRWSDPEFKKRMSILRKGTKRSLQTRGRMSVAQKNRVVSEATKQKIRLARKEQPPPNLGKKFSESHKRNLSKAHIGKNCGSRNYMFGKVGAANHISKTYNIKLVSPQGEIYGPITSLNNFCMAHELTPQHMYAVVSGKRKSHKGWRLQSLKNKHGC